MDSFYSKEFKTLIMADSGVVLGSNFYYKPCFMDYNGSDNKKELRVAYCGETGLCPLIYFVQVNKRLFHAEQKHWYWFGRKIVYEKWYVSEIIPKDFESAKSYYFNDCDEKNEEEADKYFRDTYGVTGKKED